jgi:hypothetical protein
MTCKHDGADYCLKGYLKRNAGGDCRYYERIKLYLSGPVTFDAGYREKFLRVENQLFDAGFYPVNPAACIPANTEWTDAMKQAIVLMLQCDGLVLLGGWKDSRGANIEVRLAAMLGIPARPVERWLAKRPGIPEAEENAV